MHIHLQKKLRKESEEDHAAYGITHFNNLPMAQQLCCAYRRIIRAIHIEEELPL